MKHLQDYKKVLCSSWINYMSVHLVAPNYVQMVELRQIIWISASTLVLCTPLLNQHFLYQNPPPSLSLHVHNMHAHSNGNHNRHFTRILYQFLGYFPCKFTAWTSRTKFCYSPPNSGVHCHLVAALVAIWHSNLFLLCDYKFYHRDFNRDMQNNTAQHRSNCKANV